MRDWQSCCSSELSPQSLSVSQTQTAGIHLSLAHLNWLGGHVAGGQSDSSSPRGQSMCLLHRNFDRMHLWVVKESIYKKSVAPARV